MKQGTFKFETITRCFAGGAEPEKQAEIRVPAIRGQLRWWFRVLGGFASLARQPVREQEEFIFGSAAGGAGKASRLIVRVKQRLVSPVAKDCQAMDIGMNSEEGYLLFPLRSQRRGVFEAAAFDLDILWRGSEALWPDIQALIVVLGNFGSLGFRSRRAMGALAISNPPVLIADAMARFSNPANILVRSMQAADGRNAITVLANWLKSWRAHGRTGANQAEMRQPGFRFAKVDHDIGVNQHAGPAFRPAIGLPIVQFYSQGRPRKNWEYGRGNANEPRGRFASPVLLRPHRDPQGRWRALVIFIDAHKWPAQHPVYVSGRPVAVSLDLYEAMRADQRLQPFGG